MPKIRVNGIEMHYEEAGEGEVLVLIMGFGGDHRAWGFQTRAFAEAYRVIAFDNRGAGQTDAPDHPYTTRMMADDTVGLMEALGVERAHVVGVSMGGMIAQELALNHPRRVRSLHLGCTLARPDAYLKALTAAWREVRTHLGREAALRTIGLWLFAPATYNERPELVEMILQNALANPHPQSLTGFLRQGEAVAAHDTLDRLPAIRCPTLVSVGEEDILVPPRFSRELAARIPGATRRTLPGAAHGYFWERPEAFNALCLEFLARH
ncbi:MAG TPA: alpha/beta fold hydrolase [Methylomirabilota bacterium]|jgi:pimeloyl-ACP methyl ester carboxylesterase|nr:alpha/beta fold hydrolase [Methylomirabilota bacterium]